MFSSVALDVFIGLVFIFLLYSLLATIVMEFVAHYMHLRPRLLMKALRRMLEDTQPEIFGIKQRSTIIDFFADVKESVKRYFLPFRNLHFLKRFYYHPTIKYLGESRSSSKPSYMHANNFSQTIIQLFRGGSSQPDITQLAAVEHYLFTEAAQINADYERYKHWIVNEVLISNFIYDKNLTFDELLAKVRKLQNPLRYGTRRLLIDQLIKHIEEIGSVEEVQKMLVTLAPLLIQVKDRMISAETLVHFQNLYIDAQRDLDRFRNRLEEWFNETMERASGWYKRQTQVILLCLGLALAIWANVDTIKIYKTLAKDKKVRDQIVSMAIQSQEKYRAAVDTIRTNTKTDSVVKSNDSTIIYRTKVLTTGDSILDNTYTLLQDDISTAGSILGLGWCNSDSCKAYQKLEARNDSLKKTLDILKDENPKDVRISKLKNEIGTLSKDVKAGYKKHRDDWNMLSVVGWLITALAISLGAPFWFDLLSKLIKMRSAGTKASASDSGGNNASDSKSATGNAPLIVNVNPNSNIGGEAVG